MLSICALGATEAEDTLRKIASLVLVVAVAVIVLSAFLLQVLPGAADVTIAAGRNADVPRVTTAISVDGDLHDWPAGSPLAIDAATAQYVAGTIAGTADLSAAIRFLWDNTYLYVAATVADNVIIADSSSIWDDDSLELALDGNNDKSCCAALDHQYTIAIDARFADFGTLVTPGASGVLVAVSPDALGYRVEMAIPLSNLTAASAAPGLIMGFNIGLNDDDDGGRRDKRLVWSGNSTLDFTSFAALTFVSAAGPLPTASATATPAVAATATPTSVGAATATRTATLPAAPTATRTPVATATPTTAPAATATPTIRPSATATLVVATATSTPAGQGTPSADARIAQLESNLTTLEERVLAILVVLQRAGSFPGITGLGLPGKTPVSAQATLDPLAYSQGVNCGGPAYTMLLGDFYAADKTYAAGSWGYVSGQTFEVANAISGTLDMALYQTERYNLTGYSFDVPAGVYEVTLHFAEIYQYATAKSRVFDVKLEDQVVTKALDVAARVGINAALDLAYTATITDGILDITFVAVAGQPAINGIFVRGVAPVGPTPTPSADDRLGAVSGRLTGLEALVSAILDIFRLSLTLPPTPTPGGAATATVTATLPPGAATMTATRTPTAALPTSTLTAVATATRTAIPGTATLTATPSVSPTRTATPIVPVATPHTSAKKGAAGTNTSDQMRYLGISWGYTWGLSPNNWNTVYEHVPMIWGKDYDAAVVTQLARAHPGSYWLIWNEPDYWQQANITPTQAAQIYRVLRPLIKSADPSAKLVVGGVANLDVAWLEQFRNEYFRLYAEWPVVEGWSVHYYVAGDAYNASFWREPLLAIRDWMISNGGQVELWLSEFGCLSSEATAKQLMADQIPWLESQTWLTRYAWYAVNATGPGCPSCTGSLLNTDGSLTDLGLTFRALP